MSSTTVHVIDDDEAVRQSLLFLLESAGLTVQTHASAVRFLASVDFAAPSVIVTDVRMPDMTGLQLVREMRARGMVQPVIIVTGHGDISLAVEAMKSGATDFLEKPFEDEGLLRAIRAAMPDATARAGVEPEAQRIKAVLESFSPRERGVLDGVLGGKPNKVIALELGISPRTVEAYRASVMAKIEANGVSDLVRLVLLARS